MPRYFKNPQNGHVEVGSARFWLLWAFLFGPLYFVYKGVWTHAVLFFFANIATVLVAWLVYPWFADSIVRRHYLAAGWSEVHHQFVDRRM